MVECSEPEPVGVVCLDINGTRLIVELLLPVEEVGAPAMVRIRKPYYDKEIEESEYKIVTLKDFDGDMPVDIMDNGALEEAFFNSEKVLAHLAQQHVHDKEECSDVLTTKGELRKEWWKKVDY